MLIEFSVKNYRSFWDTQTLPKKVGRTKRAFRHLDESLLNS